ncbi:LYRIC protein, partial [Atractosteus spatula]|nr:LYRIC protein [Atractosteus spatula]
MAASWQEVATRQAEEISSRLRELLSSGLGLLRSELGVDLGLKPELYPSWVLLLTAFLGLLGVAVVWAAACAGLVGGRKRGARAAEPSSQGAKAAVAKAGKPEEQKKRNKKKTVDKKAQPNGRTVVELQEDVKAAAEEVLKQAAEVKTEKTKKNKKKPKAEAKQAQNASSADGKEPDEGIVSPLLEEPNHFSLRQGLILIASDRVRPEDVFRVNVPLFSGDLHRNKPGKDAVISHVSASWTEAPAVNGGGWNDMAMKLPAQLSSVNGETWSSASEAPPRRSLEPAAWGQSTEGTSVAHVRSSGQPGVAQAAEVTLPVSEVSKYSSWTTVDARMKKPDLNPSSFTTLGLTPAVTGAEPGSQTNADLQWDGVQHKVEDEWSGLNGLSSVDPTSDWNAPAELWGNYEEEPEAQTPAQPQEPETELQKLFLLRMKWQDRRLSSVSSCLLAILNISFLKVQLSSGSSELPCFLTFAFLNHTELSTLLIICHPFPISVLHRNSKQRDMVRTERAVPALTPLSAPVQERVSQKTPSQVPQRPSGPEPAVPTAKQNSVPPPSQSESPGHLPLQLLV